MEIDFCLQRIRVCAAIRCVVESICQISNDFTVRVYLLRKIIYWILSANKWIIRRVSYLVYCRQCYNNTIWLLQKRQRFEALHTPHTPTHTTAWWMNIGFYLKLSLLIDWWHLNYGCDYGVSSLIHYLIWIQICHFHISHRFNWQNEFKATNVSCIKYRCGDFESWRKFP